MKYSLSSRNVCMDQADEIRCPYNRLGDIYDFIKQNPDKRYNIVCGIVAKEDYDKLSQQINFVKSITNNYTVGCSTFNLMKELKTRGYNVYFAYPINDWETFTNLKNMGVTDIYIDSPLTFMMNKVIEGKENVKIRVSPTISPNAALSQEGNANSFFVRPEDIALYENMIDIIDFNVDSMDTEETLFNIYKRGSFNFNLAVLVKHLNQSVSNPHILTDFAEKRLNCEQKCKVPGRKCRLCENSFYLTNLVMDHFKES